MSAAERTAQILKVVDDNRIPIVEIPRTTVDEYFTMMTGCSKNEYNSDVESSTDPVPQKEDGEEDEQVVKEMTWAAERTAQILNAVDIKVDRITYTFKKKRGSPKGSSKKCGLCGETGHNKRTCPTCIDVYALD